MHARKIVAFALLFSLTTTLVHSQSQSFPFILNVTSLFGNDTLGELHLYYRVSALINGNIGDVCYNGVTDQVADMLCKEELDIEGNWFIPVTGRVEVPPYNFIGVNDTLFDATYANLACPSGLSTCTGTAVSSCTAYGGFLTILCAIRLPDCIPGLTSLNNIVNSTTPDGAFYETGYPSVCIRGRYAPICSDVSLTSRDVSELCLRNLENPFEYFSGFVGPADGVTALPIDLLRPIDTVLTDFSCSTLFNCTNTTMMGTCPNNNYAVITCQKVCNDDSYDVILYNNYTTTSAGIDYIVGIPQFCIGGSYARVCNDGTNTRDIATLNCIGLGYQVGESLPYNPSLYSGSPRGIIYISNYTCNETGCAQSISFAYDEQCFGGQKDLIVRCYNRSLDCTNEGNITYYTRITATLNSTTEIVTGVAVICINGQYTALCSESSDDFDSSETNAVCQAMGFDSGAVRSPNSVYGRPPVTSGYYSNVTCMTNGRCAAMQSNNPQCLSGDRNIILQCYRPASASTPTSTSTTSTSTNAVAITLGVVIGLVFVVAVVVALVITMAIILVRRSKSGKHYFQ